jgi:hypothetical protein
MKKQFDNFEEVEKTLIQGSANTVSSLRCPSCGSPLVVTYTEFSDKMCLSIKCKKLCYRSNIDGLKEEPPWVRSLGNRFETN